jgi:hypothetical protein
MGLCRSRRYAVMMCSDDEVRVLTQPTRFLRVMPEARDLAELDSLIVVTIESASCVYPYPGDFKKQCYFELARSLSDNPTKLEDLLLKILD